MKKAKMNILEKERKKKQEENQRYMDKVKIAGLKNAYITNLVNGRYYLARCNMLAKQIIENKIIEKIDGATKSMEYIRSEYALMKVQAIKSMRQSYFNKKELISDYKFTEEQIHELEDDYYNGKIIREEYDTSYEKGRKAHFTNT